MLFLPLLDKESRQLNFSLSKHRLTHWLILLSLIGLLLLIHPFTQEIFLIIVAYTALPEEWFFRKYIQNGLKQYLSKTGFLKRLPERTTAIICSSLFFTALHLPTQGQMGLAVFLPSLVLGYIYQLKQDLIFVILMHTLFNLFFIIYIKEAYTSWF